MTVNVEKLNHLRFANDVMLIVNSKNELQEMLSDMKTRSNEMIQIFTLSARSDSQKMKIEIFRATFY